MIGLYDFHTNPEQLDGYENRLRVPKMAYEYGVNNGFEYGLGFTDEMVSAIAKDPWAAREYEEEFGITL